MINTDKKEIRKFGFALVVFLAIIAIVTMASLSINNLYHGRK